MSDWERAIYAITHWGEDPTYDYGLFGGFVGMIAGILLSIAKGKD